MKLQIPAMRLVQNNTVLYQIRLDKESRQTLRKEGCLQTIMYDPRTDEGTQRVVRGSRIEDLSRYIEHKDNFVPTTVLLNSRIRAGNKATDQAQVLKFKPMTPGSPFGTLVIDTATTVLSITDGNGRITATERSQATLDALNSEFDLSCVIMMKDADEEDFQFYGINDLAIRVAKDIRFVSIARIGEKFGEDRIKTLPDKCQLLAERASEARPILTILNSEDSGRFSGNPLYNKLILSNLEDDDPGNNGLIKFFRMGEVFSRQTSGLILNQKHFYPEYPDDLSRERTEKALLLCNFFKALKTKSPQCFTDQGVKDYMFFDSNSLYVFETVLHGLMSLPDNRGKVLSEATFLAYFNGADKLMQPAFWKRRSKAEAKANKSDYVGYYHGIARLTELGEKIVMAAVRGADSGQSSRRAAKKSAPQDGDQLPPAQPIN